MKNRLNKIVVTISIGDEDGDFSMQKKLYISSIPHPDEDWQRELERFLLETYQEIRYGCVGYGGIKDRDVEKGVLFEILKERDSYEDSIDHLEETVDELVDKVKFKKQQHE